MQTPDQRVFPLRRRNRPNVWEFIPGPPARLQEPSITFRPRERSISFSPIRRSRPAAKEDYPIAEPTILTPSRVFSRTPVPDRPVVNKSGFNMRRHVVDYNIQALSRDAFIARRLDKRRECTYTYDMQGSSYATRCSAGSGSVVRSTRIVTAQAVRGTSVHPESSSAPGALDHCFWRVTIRDRPGTRRRRRGLPPR